MKTLRRALAYFVLGVIILQLQAYSVGLPLSDALFNRPTYLIPVFVIVCGLVLGSLAHLLIRRSPWVSSFFILGLNISFVLFIMGVGVLRFQTWRENLRYGYNYESQRLLKSTDGRELNYVASGFKAFQAEIASPRDLQFESFISRSVITRGGGALDTTHIVYYAYYFRNDPTKYFSKVSVTKDAPTILIFNGIADHHAEYNALKDDPGEGLRQSIDSIKSPPTQDMIGALENRY